MEVLGGGGSNLVFRIYWRPTLLFFNLSDENTKKAIFNENTKKGTAIEAVEQ